MSTPAQFDSEIISQTVGVQSSQVPTPLPDDPYVAVRQAYLVNTDTEFGPLEDLRETEAHTPATVDTESEPEEAPSKREESLPLVSRVPLTDKEFKASKPSDTRTTSSHSSASSDSTAPLSPDHPLTQTSPTPTPTRVSFYFRTTCMTVCAQPAMSPGLLARVIEAMALSDLAFRKRYRSSYKTPSPSPSSTLLARKRYRVTSELIEDTRGESSDPDSMRGRDQRMRVLIQKRKRRRLYLRSTEEITPSIYEVGQSSRLVPDQQVADETPRIPERTTWIDHEDTSPAATISVDEDPFLEVGAQLELYESILHDHTQRLDALPPTLFEGHDKDLMELYTRSRADRLTPRGQRCGRPAASPAATISVDEDPFLDVGAQLELYESILHDHTQRLDALPPTLFEGHDKDLMELYISFGIEGIGTDI
ncbi:hypothetical protein Tco_0790249 [Tanacetum coccineum]